MIIKKHILENIPQKVSFVFNEHQRNLLVPISDIHFGAASFSKSHFKSTIQWAVDRGAYFIGIGDPFNFTAASQQAILDMLRCEDKKKIGSFVRSMGYELAELLEPTIGHWIGMVGGNHTWPFEDGTTIDQFLCEQMKTHYLGTSALIRLRFADAPPKHPEADVVVFVHHGKSSSAQTIAGHLIAPERVIKFIDCDLILQGHDHSKISGPSDRLYLTPDNVLCHKTTIIARCGGYLKGYEGKKPQSNLLPASDSEGNYVEQKLLPPSTIGSQCFSLGYEKIEGSAYYKPCIHGSY